MVSGGYVKQKHIQNSVKFRRPIQLYVQNIIKDQLEHGGGMFRMLGRHHHKSWAKCSMLMGSKSPLHMIVCTATFYDFKSLLMFMQHPSHEPAVTALPNGLSPIGTTGCALDWRAGGPGSKFKPRFRRNATQSMRGSMQSFSVRQRANESGSSFLVLAFQLRVGQNIPKITCNALPVGAALIMHFLCTSAPAAQPHPSSGLQWGMRYLCFYISTSCLETVVASTGGLLYFSIHREKAHVKTDTKTQQYSVIK